MPPVNALARLFKLTERESKIVEPISTKSTFKALKLSLDRLDRDWSRRRLQGVRLAVFLLKKDSEGLYGAAAADPAAFNRALPYLKGEAIHLRKSAVLVEKAAARISTVLARHEREQPQPQSQQSELTSSSPA